MEKWTDTDGSEYEYDVQFKRMVEAFIGQNEPVVPVTFIEVTPEEDAGGLYLEVINGLTAAIEALGLSEKVGIGLHVRQTLVCLIKTEDVTVPFKRVYVLNK